MNDNTYRLMVATTAAGVTAGAVLASQPVLTLLLMPVSGPLLAVAALLAFSAIGGGAGVLAGRQMGKAIFPR